MNEDLEQLMATQAGYGDTTVDDVLKRELLREIIYTDSGSLSVGTELVPTQQMDQLGVEFTYPGETTADYPVGPDTQADRRRIQWTDFKIRLQRGQTRYFMSDGAKLEGMADQHAEAMEQRAAEALARRKDENILCTLANGAYSENEEDVTTAWDDYDPESEMTDLIDGLWQMWEEILVNAPVNNMDIDTMAVALPAEVYTHLNRLELINNIQQRVEDYLGQAFGFAFYPHKIGFHEDDQDVEQYGVNLRDTAIMMLPGSETAVHGELSQSAAAAANVPLVEGPNREFGRGEDYMITQWFNTAIMEHESGNEGETPRISVRTGVNSNA